MRKNRFGGIWRALPIPSHAGYRSFRSRSLADQSYASPAADAKNLPPEQRFRIRDGKYKKLSRFAGVGDQDQILQGDFGFAEQSEASFPSPRSSQGKTLPS